MSSDTQTINPEAVQHLDLAYDHHSNARLEEALEECDLAIECEIDWAEAHNLRGILMEELGQGQEAVKEYEMALLIDPSFAEARDNLAELRSENRANFWQLDSSQVRLAIQRGALGVIGALLIGVILNRVPMPAPNSFWFSLKAWLVHLVEAGIIAGTLGTALGFQGRGSKIAWVGAGILGGGVGWFLGDYIVFVAKMFNPRYFTGDLFVWSPEQILSWVLMGGCLGAALGVVLADWNKMLGLALAGLVGFGAIGCAYAWDVPSYMFFEFTKSMGWVGARPDNFLIAVFFVFFLGESLVIGLVLGAPTGAALGWIAARKRIVRAVPAVEEQEDGEEMDEDDLLDEEPLEDEEPEAQAERQ